MPDFLLGCVHTMTHGAFDVILLGTSWRSIIFEIGKSSPSGIFSRPSKSDSFSVNVPTLFNGQREAA